MKVTVQEIIYLLDKVDSWTVARPFADLLVQRIKQHGIAVEYTPMTDDEIVKEIHLGVLPVYKEEIETVRRAEQVVLARLGVAPTLDQAKAICEQAGFAVVPKKPTKHMIKSAERSCWYDKYNDELVPETVYKAMLEAAKEVKP